MKMIKNNRKSADSDLECVSRERQQRMNELDVVVPLRLHQVITRHLPTSSVSR